MSMTLTEANVVHEGWRILVEQLGLYKATEFVILLERGKGDSVEEINAYWANAGIDEIRDRVAAWKMKQS